MTQTASLGHFYMMAKKKRLTPFYYFPHALQTLTLSFSQSNFTPVFWHEGQVPLQPSVLIFLPRFALAMH